MRLARCPECRRRRLLIKVPGSKGQRFRFRQHKEPKQPDQSIQEAVKTNPPCPASGKIVPLEETIEL